MIPDFDDALLNLVEDYLKRGKSSFFISKPPIGAAKHNIAALALGTQNAINVENGYIITVGLKREQLQLIKIAIDELLSEPDN